MGPLLADSIRTADSLVLPLRFAYLPIPSFGANRWFAASTSAMVRIVGSPTSANRGRMDPLANTIRSSRIRQLSDSVRMADWPLLRRRLRGVGDPRSGPFASSLQIADSYTPISEPLRWCRRMSDSRGACHSYESVTCAICSEFANGPLRGSPTCAKRPVSHSHRIAELANLRIVFAKGSDLNGSLITRFSPFAANR